MSRAKRWCWIAILGFVFGLPGAGHAAGAPKRGKAIQWEILDRRQGLADNVVNAICPADTEVYLGTAKGLSVYHRTTKRVTRLGVAEGLPNETISALAAGGARLWIGTGQGLAVLEGGRLTQPLPADSPLSRLAITALVCQDDILFVGTSQGLFYVQTRTSEATAVAELADQNITALSIFGPYLLVVGSPDKLDWMELKSHKVEPLIMEFNPLLSAVTGAGGQGDTLWFTTDGSGLIGHNLIAREWFTLNRASGGDSNLTALAADGVYLWVGGFSGLSRYNTSTGVWEGFQDKHLPEQRITTLAPDGATLWIGTSGGGAAYGRVRVPYVLNQLPRRYFGQEAAFWKGQAQGEGAVSVRVTYQRLDAGGRWLSGLGGATLKGHELQGKLDLRGLVDGKYRVRVSVRDGGGHGNSETFTLIKETKPIILTFKAGAMHGGRVRIEGSYHPDSVETIFLEPGHVQATLDPKTKSFAAELDIVAGTKQIRFTAHDQAGQNRVFLYPLSVSNPPQVEVSVSAEAFTPGYDVVQFNVAATGLGSVDRWILNVTAADGTPIKKMDGRGEPPQRLTWDGADNAGNTVAAETIYLYSLQVVETGGWQVTTPQRAIRASAQGSGSGAAAIKVDEPILFDSGRIEIKPYFRKVFEALRTLRQEHPQAMILIEGHADDRPIYSVFKSNQILSEARAKAVADCLVTQYAVDSRFITQVGFGASRPAAPNKTWRDRYSNRRVEISLIDR